MIPCSMCARIFWAGSERKQSFTLRRQLRRRRLITQPRVTPWVNEGTNIYPERVEHNSSIPNISLVKLNLISPQELAKLILKRNPAMMTLLSSDVALYLFYMGLAD